MADIIDYRFALVLLFQTQATAKYYLIQLPVLLLFTALLSANAQTPPPTDDPLPRLLAERQVLTRQYAAANAQRHSLFGNKPSKKDLQEVVDALQGIVDKDQQIVDALNRTTQAAQTAARHYSTTATQLQNTSRGDRNLTAQRLAEAENDLANARERQRQAAIRQRELEAEVQEARQGRTTRDVLIAGLGLLCVGLVFWRRKR